MTIAVVVIHSDEGTSEGEGFAVGYEERGVNDAGVFCHICLFFCVGN